MARRRIERPESLELFLDTVCNTFGGVLFIALLVVMLLPTVPAVKSRHNPTGPDELQKLKHRLQQLAAERQRLQQSADAQSRLLQQFAPDEVRNLVDLRASRRAQLDAAIARQQRIRDQLDAARANMDQQEQESVELAAQADELRRALEQSRSTLSAERKKRVQQLNMPVVRPPRGKQEVGFILRYGRAYLWHRYDRFGNRLGLNTDEFVVVDNTLKGLVTAPKPSAGIPLDAANVERQIRERLRPFNPEQHYVAVVVRPDSFQAFRPMRDALIALHFEYRLIPTEEDEPFVDRGGTGDVVQ